ncbi:MAG: hypothetical protein ACLFQX_03175 [Candidatus Kapaibacterium sp.]
MNKSLRKGGKGSLKSGDKTPSDYNKIINGLREKLKGSPASEEDLEKLIREFNEMLKTKSSREIHAVLNKIILRNEDDE